MITTQARHLILAAMSILLFSAVGSANDNMLECRSKAGTVKAVALTDERAPNTDFSGTGGALDPEPLLQTVIRVGKNLGRHKCIIAHFSAQVVPHDSFIMFQVSVDGVPMAGHARFPFITPSPETPVVWDSNVGIENYSILTAYNFFIQVEPGEHRVEVRFANCCSEKEVPPNPSRILSAVLTLEY
jgi:hypothetical protein